MNRRFVPSVVPLSPPSPASRWYLGGAQGLVVREGEELALPTGDEARALGATSEAHYLGRLDGIDRFAAAPPATPPAPFVVKGLRQLFRAFDEAEFGVAALAIQTLEWATTSRFCGRCATATKVLEGERAMVCPACGLRAWPRIAPAVIVLVRRGDRALLARGANFPTAFYSTVAGFVEPGEELEATVAREVREEVGIEVERVRYFGSQPWPFPHSLMIGFTADYAGGELRPDGREILDAGWYEARALPNIPPRPAIARRLIDAWLAECGVEV